jgi:hypothetical protein
MLVKLYGNDRAGEARYSPAECIGCKEIGITGRPDPKHISTSFVERQNLTEFSQLPTFFRFFALIFIVKPRVFIIAF